MTAFRCAACEDDGHVCENHPNIPFEDCCGGAGIPCPACCSPIPQDGTHSIGEAFTPDWRRGETKATGGIITRPVPLVGRESGHEMVMMPNGLPICYGGA